MDFSIIPTFYFEISWKCAPNWLTFIAMASKKEKGYAERSHLDFPLGRYWLSSAGKKGRHRFQMANQFRKVCVRNFVFLLSLNGPHYDFGVCPCGVITSGMRAEGRTVWVVLLTNWNVVWMAGSCGKWGKRLINHHSKNSLTERMGANFFFIALAFFRGLVCSDYGHIWASCWQLVGDIVVRTLLWCL